MEDNEKKTINNLNNIQDMLNSQIGELNKTMKQFSDMMPKTRAKKIKIKGVLATAYMQTNGHIAINFDSDSEAEKFFNSLK